jgi:integrase
VSPVTLDGYRNTVEHHIHPAIGALALQSLTPSHLSSLYATKLSSGCSPRVVVLMHRRLSQALKMATEHGLVTRNVADAVKPPRDLRKEQPTWTAQEVRRFLDVAQASSYGPIWLLSLATGMRKGELLGLTLVRCGLGSRHGTRAPDARCGAR